MSRKKQKKAYATLYIVRTKTTGFNPERPELTYSAMFNKGLYFGFTKKDAEEDALKTLKEAFNQSLEVLSKGLVLEHKVVSIETVNYQYVRNKQTKNDNK